MSNRTLPVEPGRDSADGAEDDAKRFPERTMEGVALARLCSGSSYGFLAALRGGYEADEMEHLHGAWNVGQGLLPYRDFFEHHPPLLYYLLAPFVRSLTHASFALFVALRLVALGLFVLILAGLVRLSRRICRRLWRTGVQA